MHIDLIPYYDGESDYPQYRGKKYDMIVLFDIFRATSTITALKEAGAETITVSGSTDSLIRIKKSKNDSFICGERGGLAPDGFDSGNSPLEIVKLDLKAKNTYITTTNGTRALKAFQECSEDYRAVSLFNLEYSAKSIASDESVADLLVVCAGTEDQFSIEDYAAASMLINSIAEKTEVDRTDTVKVCDRIGKIYNNDFCSLYEDLADSFHAKRLEKIGKKPDVEFILNSINVFEVFAKLYVL